MTAKRKGKKKNFQIIKIGVFLMLLGLSLLIVRVNMNSVVNKMVKDLGGGVSETTENKTTGQVSEIWTTYMNEEYSIVFSRPRFLLKRENRQSDVYEFFVMFEENQYSKEKGLAFGVSKGTLKKEVERIRDEMITETNNKLTKNESVKIAGLDGWILVVEPGVELLEKRGFLFVEKGDYVYSFSTVPEQMQRVQDSIVFIE